MKKGSTYVMADEHRKKIALAKKGLKFSDEHRRKISEAMKGKKNAKKKGEVE